MSKKVPLRVKQIISPKHLSKVLMDGGSGLNILYINTSDSIRLVKSVCSQPECPSTV